MLKVAVILLVALTRLDYVTSVKLLVNGEILLGGLVPIHSKGSTVADRECGELHSRLGVQRLEAMLFAVDQINSNPRILQNISLGVKVYDTCSSETRALDKAVNFISSRLSGGKNFSSQSPVAGVIGASYSSVSIQIAHLLRLFQVPQISFDSTSVELSDKKKFEYFSRTVPHDGFQAKAIVDVVRYYNWTYISSVYSDDTYGIHGMEALRKETKRAGICIATAQMIKVSKSAQTPDAFAKIIDAIVAEPLAKTVVVFTSQESHIRSLLKAAQQRGINNKIQWVGSDAWGNILWLNELRHLADSAITVSPKSVRLKDFEDYFTNLNPENNTRNPWFKEYWQIHFRCSLNSTINRCNDSLRLTPSNSNIDMRVASAIDAVHVFAHALNAMHADLCPGYRGLCGRMTNISGSNLLGYIRKVSFQGATGFKVAFDGHGDVEGIYDIKHFRKRNNIHENIVIGQWAEKLSMRDRNTLGGIGFRVVTSSCTAKCSSNEVVVPVKGKESCCTECVHCNGNSYVVNRTTCVKCADGYWPLADGKGCEQIEVLYFGIHLIYSIPTMVLAGAGVIFTVFVVIMLAKNDQTPIVKACGREMAYLILVGILLCFLHTFIVVAKPSEIICLVRFFTGSIAFSICYAAIFIKTNRISRIFNRRNIARRPILILPTSQLILVLGVVCIQALFLVMLALLRIPKASIIYPTVSTVYLECSVEDLDFGLSQVYNFMLILVCTLYAFKTRKIPSNFNEAKFIAFAMYCTCVVWLAFLAIYFMKTSSLERSLILCISVSLVAYVLLGTLFGPKMYILLFKPHRNVRKPVTSLSLSSINHAHPKCPKCSYVAVNMSIERDSDQAQNSSDDPIEGNSTNRMSLLDHTRPQSLYTHDGLTIKPDVEKLIMFMRKELQATKYALKAANEKLRQKIKEEHCNEEEPIDRKRPKAGKEVKVKSVNGRSKPSQQELTKNSGTLTVCPLCIETADSKRENEAQDIKYQNRLNKQSHKSDIMLNKPIDRLKVYKRTNSHKCSVLCPGCEKAFQLDPLCPWRKSYSLSDIDSKLNVIVNTQTLKDNSLGDIPVIGSKENDANSPSSLLEPWHSLLIPPGALL